MALGKVDAQLAELLEHAGRLDELGHRRHPDHLRDVAEAPHRRQVQRIAAQLADELAVDLQHIHRQRLQIAEGRGPGAEVVQRDADAQRAHRRHEARRIMRPGDRRGLGDLEAQHLHIEAGLAHQVGHIVAKAPVAERLARQVDRDALGAQPGDGRPVQLREDLSHHPAIDAGGQLEALRRRQEMAGRHQRAVVAVTQPQQHLAVQAAVLAADRQDALRVQLEAVLVERLLEPARPVHLTLVPAQRLVGVEPEVDPVAPGLLGDIAGRIGGLHYRIGLAPAGIQRHQADARSHPEAPAVMHEAEFLHALADQLRDTLRLMNAAALQQHAELVAAQTRQRVARSHAVAQQLADLQQQPISGRVAAGIVDQLELVQIEIEQRMAGALLARTLQHLLQAPVELAAVEQTGQQIVTGAPAHLAVEPALLGHIMKDQHHAGQPPLRIMDGRSRILDAAFVAAAGDQPQRLAAAHRTALGQTAVQGMHAERQALLLVDRLVDRLDRQALRGPMTPAGHAFGRRIHPQHMAASIGGDDRIGDRMQRDLQQLAAVVQGLDRLRHLPAQPGQLVRAGCGQGVENVQRGRQIDRRHGGFRDSGRQG